MPDPLSFADPTERRRPSVAAELRAMADAAAGPAKRLTTPTDAPRDDAPATDAGAARGLAVARALQREGITSARWVKRRGSYRLDVAGHEAARAVEVMRSWE